MTANFADQLNGARNQATFDDYISAVKNSVITEIKRLDPSVQVRRTEYFNHSAIPDLVLEWSKSDTRMVYLRHSYTSVLASRDSELLNDLSPVILTVAPDDEEPAVERASARRLTASLSESESLVTEPDALERIASSNVDSPVASLVRNSFLSDARGLIDTRRADRVMERAEDVSDRPILDENMFPTSIASKINAALALMRIAMNPENSSYEEWPPLQREQAKQILPWLLKTNGVRTDAHYWRHIGTGLNLGYILGELSSELHFLELWPLIGANAEHWPAVRGYLGVGDSDPDQVKRRWTIVKNRLVGYVGEVSMTLAANRHLKGREDTLSSADWEVVRNQVTAFALRGISLRGLQRDIQLDAASSHDLKGDVDRVASSLTDQYYVDNVNVLFQDRYGQHTIDARLGPALASSEDGASIAQFIEVIGKLLAYRSPLQTEQLDELLTQPLVD